MGSCIGCWPQTLTFTEEFLEVPNIEELLLLSDCSELCDFRFISFIFLQPLCVPAFFLAWIFWKIWWLYFFKLKIRIMWIIASQRDFPRIKSRVIVILFQNGSFFFHFYCFYVLIRSFVFFLYFLEGNEAWSLCSVFSYGGAQMQNLQEIYMFSPLLS